MNMPVHRLGRCCSVAALLLVTAVRVPGEIRLAPPFSSDMVLQRGGKATLYGHAAPRAKVNGLFRGRKFDYMTAKASGEWELKLDLQNPKETSPGVLEFTEEISGRPTDRLVLTNVAVGQVWWLGVRSVNSMPAPDRAIDAVGGARDRIRFINLDTGPWVSLAHPANPTNCIDAFALAAARNLVTADSYIGIIQVSPEAINRLGPDKLVKPDPAGRYARVNSWREQVRANVNREVAGVRSANQLALIKAKHQGRIANLPLPDDYLISTVRLREDCKPVQSGTSKDYYLFDFEGAIW